jgi:type II secretory pathway pseudopilin PulG
LSEGSASAPSGPWLRAAPRPPRGGEFGLRSASPRCARRFAALAGFTFVEILVAIFLIGLLSAVLLPRLGIGTGRALRTAADVVVAELGHTAERAAASGHEHRWLLDLDRQAFRIERLTEVEDPTAAVGAASRAANLSLAPPRPAFEYRPLEAAHGEWRWLDEETVEIDEVVVMDESHDEGEIAIAFGPDGGADSARLRLVDEDGFRIDLEVLAFTGEVRRIEDPEP